MFLIHANPVYVYCDMFTKIYTYITALPVLHLSYLPCLHPLPLLIHDTCVGFQKSWHLFADYTAPCICLLR